MSSPTISDSSLTTPRLLVLCFDGTSSKYDNNNTNVVKFVSLLAKDRTSEQLIYYQPGIGTYVNPSGVFSPLGEYASEVIDEAIAWYLDTHVRDGYRFLMENHRSGDKVCMFGFSRGAYTARALAGFLYKVGLLPRGSDEQVPSAFNLYKRTDKASLELCSGFKQTFCRPVPIEFVGVWETVSSVGIIIGPNLPFTASNTAIRVFRQALSLDEHRARFQPNLYHLTAPNTGSNPVTQLLSNIIPKRWWSVLDKTTEATTPQPPPQDDEPDYLEVWFAGCHADVGGGSVDNSVIHALSDIPFRWMVREAVQAQCGVIFDPDALLREGIDITALCNGESKIPNGIPNNNNNGSSPADQQPASDADDVDALMPIYDQLVINKAWWIVEFLPTRYAYQNAKGVWRHKTGLNLGRGRIIRVKNPKFHISVKERMEDASLKYTPRAKWTKGNEIYVD